MVEHREMNRAGFSLVEVLVTIAIMGLMLTAVTQMLTSVRFARDIVHNEQEEYLAGPAILDQLERDLQAIYVTNLLLIDHMKIEDKVVGGMDADRIDFACTTDNLIWQDLGDRQVRADVNEVGYCLRSNPNDNDFLELYRREGFGVDTDPHTDGVYIFMHDRVRAFNIEIFTENGPEDMLDPLDEWGQDESDPDLQGLPAFMRVTLEVELEPRLLRETMLLSKQLKTYVRVINMPAPLRFGSEGEIPRLMIPTGAGGAAGDPETGPETGDEGSGGGIAGGGGGGRGNEGDKTDRDVDFIEGERTGDG